MLNSQRICERSWAFGIDTIFLGRCVCAILFGLRLHRPFRRTRGQSSLPDDLHHILSLLAAPRPLI